MRHFTIATSSGIVWLMLVCHFGAALIALVAGTIALSVTKGGRLHKRSGLVFTCAMIATGVLAAAISVYEGKSVVGGAFAAYLVFTAATTVTGSFFLGQMQFVPAPMRVVPLLLVLAIAPLVLLLYWLWRVRLRGRVSGLIFAE